MALLLLSMGVCALAAGITGGVLARSGAISLFEPFYSAIPRAKHAAFLADLWAHTASYLAGFLGGCILALRTWLSRQASAHIERIPNPG
jgi:hypothetical protein